MIDKFDYSDLYKFLVSAGIVLIGLALFLPWIYLKEPFDLLIDQSKLSSLTPQAQELIRSRQNLLIYCYPVIPWISVSLFVFGAISVVYGLRNWFIKQINLDKKDILAVRREEIELRKMTEEEVKEKNEKEYQEASVERIAIASDSSKSNYISTYTNIEQFFYNRIKKLYSGKYNIHQNVRFGKYEFDLLMNSKLEEITNYIIEFKYLIHKRSISNMDQIISKQISASSEYLRKVKANTKSILIFIISHKIIDDTELENVKEKFEKDFFKIVMISDDLNKLSDDFFISIFEGEKKDYGFYIHKSL